MSEQKITLTDRELGVFSLALIKCDVLSDMGTLSKPWCYDHDDAETDWILLKIARMRGEL
jgi:hypothetical protein